ncbi:MAG TPA: GntG family PLP-dependent aldolase [Gemmatimonadales bacterium]|nr:GntG family PLP-dependent aldolase [Gemmatimonadales bacterium]
MPPVIDLRSDTVTRPSAAMRRAMAEAEVGDDVLEHDPTTLRLEERIAALLGKDAALFFPSGTQANQTGIRLLATPGTELLLEANAHLLHYEIAGLADLSRVQVRPVATPDGVLTAELLRAAVRPASPHVPRCSGIAIENTHNAAGGKVMPVAVADGVGALAKELRLPLHLDGARLWNAAAALGVPPARLAAPATTVMVSLSKGLGCPVGSCLAFPKEAREEAWEIRKRLGGGMRQSGILTAAGLWALEHNLGRIAEDHANAKRLADGLAGHPAVRMIPPETNILIVDLLREPDTSDTVIPRLAARGVLVTSFGPRRLRAVTHLDVTDSDIRKAIEIIAEVLK